MNRPGSDELAGKWVGAAGRNVAGKRQVITREISLPYLHHYQFEVW